jgi:dipeptidyl aminopeptidase/acylaminoacyl peptidase
VKRFFRQKRYWLTTLIVLVLALVVYFGGGYVVYAKLATIDQSKHLADYTNNPSNFIVADSQYQTFNTTPYEVSSYREVAFPSRSANLSLSGWYIEVNPQAPVVIITAGIRSYKKDAKVLVPAGMLAHNGFNVLMFDLRNHGDSDKDNGRTSVGNKEYLDVLGAWDYMIAKGYSTDRIGFYGVSLGAASDLIAFGQEPRLAALFEDSGFGNLPEIMTAELVRSKMPTFLVTPAEIMARVVGGENLLAFNPSDAINHDNNRPIYIVHGTGDTRVSVNQTRELEALAKSTGANVTVWYTDGIDHLGSVFTFPTEYQQRMVGFFKASLK